MKILNNTVGRVQYWTAYDMGGKSGGDCGWIEPNTPAINCGVPEGATNFKLTLSVTGIVYPDLPNDTFVQVISSALPET